MFRTPLLIVLLGAASAASPHTSAGQVLADTTVDLPPVVVEAVRNNGSATSSARLTTIDLAALEALPIRSVADALDRRTSVHVIRYGPSGTATASIRGVGGKHTSVYLDGLLLSDPQSNQVDLSLIPIIMLESLEIAHGPGSAARGTGSLGGSIALNTLQAGDRTRLKIGLEAGEFGQRRLGAAGAAKAGPLAVTFAAEAGQTIGDYPYSNPTLIDPTEMVREGADKSASTLYGSVLFTRDNHHVSVSTWINSVARGLPGPANAPPSDARQWDDHARVWLKSDHRLGLWLTDFSALVHGSKLRYANPATATDDLTRTTTAEIQGTASRVLGTSWFATAGLKGGFDQSGDISEQRLAVFGEATYESNRVMLFPSARLESWIADDESGARTKPLFVPRLGMNVRLSESDVLHAKASVGRSYRIPSFLERYWTPGGNPSLLAESGWSFDTSVHAQQGARHAPHAPTSRSSQSSQSSQSSSFVQTEIGIFYTDLKNQIAWFPSLVGSGVQVWRPFNVGRVVTYGTELAVDARTRVGRSILDAGFSATLSRAVDRSDEAISSYGKQLRYTPRVTGSLFAGLTINATTLNVSARHVGRRFVTSDESMNMNAYTVFDVQAGYQTAEGTSTVSFTLQLENVFNTRYSVIRFYPMPPRTITLRAGFNF